ncbi:tRNA (uridine(54)-C5)-methyltransferase TrmA [Thalassotalea sp. HSM 43]|uniref:tRNA (uridine(54)-C5)-methyltransferase TrmA n=1 Tax=Thalassotalea sp. HSM 43 TaxID=2552945 RepID=UPI0010821575|nr:tRNA (uridine(54)-C5)-methyltransferase TrmA [Thalassotalea sp. HSM 43]QBY03958.1 tRNA (uridine(54)-C5)-methyltransferase TrmA [Thalassotalea sp. HSM 43]
MLSHIHPDNYQSQLAEKTSAMQTLFNGFSVPDAEVFQSEPLHYRLRAEFRVWHQDEDLYYIMFNQQTREKFRVDQFPVASKLINAAMQELMDYVRDKPSLRHRLFQVDFLSTLSGELLVSLLYHRQLDDEWLENSKLLKQQLSKLGPVNIIGRARKQKILVDKDYVTEVLTVKGKQLSYQQVENSFTQPNGKVNEKMLEWAIDASDTPEADLVELYCGNGNFSVALAPYYKKVLATEISKSSVNSAQLNIAANNIENLDIIRMSAEEFSEAMNGERQFRRLEGFDLTQYNYDTVLVDPPRAGMDKDSCELAARFNKIIYISCNPETLHDNLQILTKTHNIEKFALFDQFPYTHHIECGIVLVRK